MSLSDPIADMIAAVNNASRAKKESADVPASKILEAIFGILKEKGYIKNYKRMEDSTQGSLRVYLSYGEELKPAISGMKRISRPGLRKYVKAGKIPQVLNGLGSAIISTPKGVLADDTAREQRVGGEVVCYVW